MFRAELARAYAEGLASWLATGEVVMPEHKARIEAIVSESAQAAVVAGGKQVKAFNGLEAKDFAETFAMWALRYIAQEAVRRRIVNITETTRAQIVAGVTRGWDEGLGQDGTARILREMTPGLARQRSAVIARTEVHGAANYGAIVAAKETGLEMGKTWIAVEDHRTRPDHADMNGTRVAMDDTFAFPGYDLAFPGDPNGPPEGVVNCRCVLAFDVV